LVVYELMSWRTVIDGLLYWHVRACVRCSRWRHSTVASERCTRTLRRTDDDGNSFSSHKTTNCRLQCQTTDNLSASNDVVRQSYDYTRPWLRRSN